MLLTNLAQVIKNKECALIRKEDQVGLIPVEITVDGVVVAWSVESDEEDVLLEGAMVAISRLFRLTWLLDSTATSQLPSSADPVMPFCTQYLRIHFFTIGTFISGKSKHTDTYRLQ